MPGTRLLIVDQDEEFREKLSAELSAEAFDVEVAGDRAQALWIAQRFRPELMLIEAFGAGAEGRTLAADIRDLEPARPIGVLYLIPQEAVTPAVREAYLGLDDFVVKPPFIPELVERLYTLLLRMVHMQDVVNSLGHFVTKFGGLSSPRRMRLTVMFADVRGFTKFSEKHDPETVAATINNLAEYMGDSVVRFGGSIDKFLGDGMMGLFGLDEYSQDHELAAMYSAQEIMDDLNRTHTLSLFAGTEMAMGIGLHSGDAVVGPVGPAFRRDITAMGDTVNVAARLCSEAQPGEIVVSTSTFAKIGDRVEVCDQRQVSLKGKRLPQQVFSVRLS